MTVRALYDAVASKYDAVVAESKYLGPGWFDAVLLSISTPSKALDLGCANGVLGRRLRARFPSVHITGFDISESMIDEARKSAAYEDLFVHDLNLPVTQISDASVDLVAALGFAEFLSDPAVLTSEVARVLAPGGTFVVSFQEHWPERPTLAPRSTRSGVVTHHAYTVAEIKALFQSQPFSVRSVESRTAYVSRSGFACPYVMVRAVREVADQHARSEA